MLTQDELSRYGRQIMLGEIGEAGQERLKRAKVFIAGAGGLGSPIATYLAVAGVGSIRIVDHDTVELSNLNRQILHWEQDIERKKVESALVKLKNLNSTVHLEALEETITEKNARELVDDYDLIVDAMDNLATRYLLNQVALEKNIPFFHGAVNGFEGRATTIIPGKTACLMCTYRGPIPKEKFPVIGVTPAVIGCIQATEVLKYLLGIGQLLTNRLLIYDGLNLKFKEFILRKNPNCEHCAHLHERR